MIPTALLSLAACWLPWARYFAPLYDDSYCHEHDEREHEHDYHGPGSRSGTGFGTGTIIWRTEDFQIQRGKPTMLEWTHMHSNGNGKHGADYGGGNGGYDEDLYVSIALVENVTGREVIEVLNASRYPHTREYAWIPPDSLDSGSYVFRLLSSFGGEPDWSPVVLYDADGDDLEEHYRYHHLTASSPSDGSVPMRRRPGSLSGTGTPAICLEARTTVIAEPVPGLSAEPEARRRLISATRGCFSYPSLSVIADPVVTPRGVVGASFDRPERRNISGCIARHPHIRGRACGSEKEASR